MDRAESQKILSRLESKDTAISENKIPYVYPLSEDEKNYYNMPEYAPLFFSDLPVNKIEKKLKESKGALLKPYEPTPREKVRYAIQSAGEYLGLSPYSAQNLSEGFMGRPEAETYGKGFGLIDAVPLANIPFFFSEDKRALDRAQDPIDTVIPLVGMSLSALEVGLLGKIFKEPIKKGVKNFFSSIKNKFTSDPPKMSKFAKDYQTYKKYGALPSINFKSLDEPILKPNMIANTKLQAPNLTMKDPKVVDEFGFYSEAERQAKMMQQNKGSGAQFQGMLLNKGVKLDEIKAYGLDELFKNEKVTKKEILDTIDLNKFVLIEKTRIGTNQPIGYEEEYFTDIRKSDGSSFASADEVKDAMDTGEYERPIIRYEDGSFNGFEIAFEGEVLTHTPTKHKIVRVQTTDSNRDEVFFTFKPEANTNDWRNSNEAKQYVDSINENLGDYGAQTKRAKTGNLTTEDFDVLVKEYAPYSFDEATVRLQANAEDGGNVPFAKFESNTQKGGKNYKEFVLSLPPIDKTKGYQDKVDIRFPSHFPEYNPVFHIRTKDRVTTDGKKVLYVEELQSDFGQQGRERGFKLKGDDLEKAKANLLVAEDNLMKLKDIQVKLTPTEVENLFKLKNPKKIMLDPMDKDILNTVKSFTAESDVQLINPYKAPPEYAYATIEEVAKLRQYENYKALHKLGDISDEFFNQLDLSQLGRTRDEIKEQIIRMFSGERLDRGSVTYPYKDEFQSGSANITRDEADDIIKKYYKAKTQTKGEDAPIPDAPFVKDTEKWTGLAIKRLLQMAEKGDYDHIAFSPGQVQFDRWREDGLIKYYDEIIPNVARDVTKKMKDKSANMNTTGFVDIEIPIKSPLDLDFGYKPKKQKTFAINITPKMRDIVRGGMPLFSTVGGMMSLGALGSMPSTQDGGT